MLAGAGAKGATPQAKRAADRIRTDDNHVGNVMLYQLSYSRNLSDEMKGHRFGGPLTTSNS